jgi:hypothetical protein
MDDFEKLLTKHIESGETITDRDAIQVLLVGQGVLIEELERTQKSLNDLGESFVNLLNQSAIDDKRNRLVANSFAMVCTRIMEREEFDRVMEKAVEIIGKDRSEDLIRTQEIDPEGETEKIIKKMRGAK